jgi:hypothetical protein
MSMLSRNQVIPQRKFVALYLSALPGKTATCTANSKDLKKKQARIPKVPLREEIFTALLFCRFSDQ